MDKINQRPLARLICCAAIGCASPLQAWSPGTIPPAPQPMHTRGFAVNNHDRIDVVAFWHAVYQASEGYSSRINWTGNYSGNNGTVSAAFAGDVERRLNYFRAMCGVHSNAVVNSDAPVVIDITDPVQPGLFTLKSTAAQNAALMLARNYNPSTGQNPALTHSPPNHLVGWSTSAWNASAKGNFAFGLYGPDAITEYMVEALSASATTSAWNSLVGHRRWNLHSPATVFATGDQPGTSVFNPPTNVFYVLQNPTELVDVSNTGFVAYPSAGYFPVLLNSPYWSLSLGGANFSAATVKMTDAAGNAVAISGIQRSNHYGDPAIIWQVPPSVAVRSTVHDLAFDVRVSGISGVGVPSSYHYRVTLINPDLLPSGPAIEGPSLVSAKGSDFSLVPPQGSEAVQVVAYKTNSKRWIENAQSPKKSKVGDGTAPSYPLMAKTASFTGFGTVSGTSSFRLTFPTAYDLLQRKVPDQWFELDRDIIAKKKSKLSFLYRRGFMTKSSCLVVETSTNGGATWKALGPVIKGISDTKYDVSVTSTSRKLPKSSNPIRVRFRYFSTGGSIYTHEAAPNAPTGIFIDEITTSNCDWLEQKKVTELPPSERRFGFSSKSAGAKFKKGEVWQLKLRTRLGGKWLQLGPTKPIKIAK